MKNNGAQNQLLEIYKLHAEFADRVSQPREGANRLYTSLLAGLTAFAATLLRYGSGEVAVGPLLAFLGLTGAVVSVSWFFVILSHRKLNEGKFKVLQELEKSLDYPFFTREWELLRKGRGPRRRYWRLSAVEMSLPWIFLLLSAGLVGLSLLSGGGSP